MHSDFEEGWAGRMAVGKEQSISAVFPRAKTAPYAQRHGRRSCSHTESIPRMENKKIVGR